MRMKLLQRSGAGAGEEVNVPEAGLVIGRGEEADLRVPDRGASRAHCRIRPAARGFSLEDLGSKNGTLVNGLPVKETALRLGDVFQVGGHAFQVLAEEEDTTATAARWRSFSWSSPSPPIVSR